LGGPSENRSTHLRALRFSLGGPNVAFPMANFEENQKTHQKIWFSVVFSVIF
jgi:hypothetical protein